MSDLVPAVSELDALLQSDNTENAACPESDEIENAAFFKSNKTENAAFLEYDQTENAAYKESVNLNMDHSDESNISWTNELNTTEVLNKSLI